MGSVVKKYTMRCDECGFSTHDQRLMENHSCDVQLQGGHCEDYPACGHELGDCNGLLYGSDEAIKEQVYHAFATGHGECDHAEGIYNCDIYDEDDVEEPDEPHCACGDYHTGTCCEGTATEDLKEYGGVLLCDNCAEGFPT